MKYGATVTSSIEYPKNMSFVIFLALCPLRCPYCSNSELLEDGEEISFEELKKAVGFCHARNVKVNVTLNTILYDRELEEFKETVKQVAACGVDAIIAQDLASAKIIKEAEAQGNLRKEEIINEAKLEATRRLTMAKEEIEREIAMQEDDIRNQIISIAFLAAEKIVGNQIDQEQYLEAVTKIIESGMNNE